MQGRAILENKNAKNFKVPHPRKLLPSKFSRYTVHQILILSTTMLFISYDESGSRVKEYYLLAMDPNVSFGSEYHLAFLIPSVIFFTLYSILPALLLTLYPFRVFRSCLSKCHLNFISVHTFVEKVNHWYRNGLDGDTDMRSLSGLYFFIRKATFLTAFLSYKFLNVGKWSFRVIWFPIGTLFFGYCLHHSTD